MCRHRTFFPVVVVGLTITLLAVIVLFGGNNDFRSQSKSEPVAPTAYEYENFARALIARLESDLSADVQAQQKRERVISAQESLLAMYVPVSRKDAHLELVIALSFLSQGYLGDDVKLSEGNARLNNLRSRYEWLRN